MNYFHKALLTLELSLTTPTEYNILIIGDSIAFGTSNGSGNADNGLLFEYDETTFNEVVNDLANANTGSPYPAMANELATPTYIYNTGSPGSEFAPNPTFSNTNNWSDKGALYTPMKNNAKDFLTLRGITKFNAIVITLGVNDAIGSADISTVEPDARSLIVRLQIDFPNTKIIINQMGNSPAETTRYNTVRAVIDDLVTDYSNVVAGFDLNTLASSFFYDGLHLSQAGNDLFGIGIAGLIKN